MSALVKVNFHGQDIDCVRDADGVWVALKRLCENIGLDYPTQFTKLKARAWATVGQRPIVAEDGKTREMSMLQLDTVPMWLATIDADRVSPEAKPKIELYQKECAKALRDYWFKGQVIRGARGRPLMEDEPKTEQLTLRLTPRKMNELRQIVATTGVSATTFVEQAIRRDAHLKNEVKALHVRTSELRELRLTADRSMRTLLHIQKVCPLPPKTFALFAAATISDSLVDAILAL